MNKQLLYIVMIMLLSGCSPRIAQTDYVRSRDSVVVTQIVRDTTVIIRPDSSFIQALIECDSVGKARLKELLAYKAGNNLQVPVLTIKDNILTAKAKIDSTSIALSYIENHRERYANNDSIVTKIVEVNRPNTLQKALQVIGLAAIALTAIYIIIKLLK